MGTPAHIKDKQAAGVRELCRRKTVFVVVPLDPSAGALHTVFLREIELIKFTEEEEVSLARPHLPTHPGRASLACVMYSSLLAPLPLPVVIHR